MGRKGKKVKQVEQVETRHRRVSVKQV